MKKPETTATPEVRYLNVQEYRVRGSKLLSGEEIGKAVYPFLGPYRTQQHIEEAASALQAAYHSRGYQTVEVAFANPSFVRGVVFLEVRERAVGTVRVTGAKFHMPSQIRRKFASLTPGGVPNFNDVQRDTLNINAAGLSVSPSLIPVDDETVDFEILVKDEFPLKGNISLNNRYNQDTTPLRLSGGLSYENLWQWGHTLGFSFQVAPENPADATVYSAFYTIPMSPSWGITFSGMKQDSDISTLGGAAVVGRGEIYGIKANFDLPSELGGPFYHTMGLGLDSKHFDEDVAFAGEETKSPIDYYPMSLSYYASNTTKKGFTEGGLSAIWSFRGMGSDLIKFDNKRFRADGSFLLFKGDVSHVHDMKYGFQIMGKLQGQYTNYPLINTEQFAGGGVSTVRGYLEASALGDSGWFGTLELRSPSFLAKRKPTKSQDAAEIVEDETDSNKNEWRLHAFLDGGRLFLNQALPDQVDLFDLMSVGLGTRINLWDHFQGSLDAAMPLRDLGTTSEGDWFVSFSLSSEF